MSVLYPPQELIITREELYQKFSDVEKVGFLYVGSQVKRKGGAEVLKAFQELYYKYQDFSLVFIGNTWYTQESVY
jgi:hypothetical protein